MNTKLFTLVFLLSMNWSLTYAAEWQAMPPINIARSHHAAGVIGSKLYIFGGEDAAEHKINSIEVLDTNAPDAWSMLTDTEAPDISAVNEFAGAVSNDKFYTFGGYYGVTPNPGFNFVGEYDPANAGWAVKKSMPTNRYLAVAAAYDQEILVFGGEYAQYDNSKTTFFKVVEAFKPSTDTWRKVTNMPQLRLLPAVAIANKKAYVIGGGQITPWKAYSNVYAYDFVKNKWQTAGLTALPTPRIFAYGHAAPVLNGKIYLIGGATVGKKPSILASRKVEIYDPVSNTWQIGPDLPQAALYGVAVATDNALYVIGGQTADSQTSIVNNVWKLTDAWQATLGSLQTCDLNADGKFSNIDANLFTTACKNRSAYWQCDLNSDGFRNANDSKAYKLKWKKAGRSCRDGVLDQVFVSQTSNLEVEGQGTVIKILADDNNGDRHQRFIIRLNSGQTLLIAHNIDIAPRINALHMNDTVHFKGEYEWNNQGGVLHWTHHDPQNEHVGGWIVHAGIIYQ
ncbi:MAG: DUF3465 domain-containing protein [Methylococcales bacterium]